MIFGSGYFFQIRWQDRFINAPVDENIFVSVDGTDYKITEPKPFNPGWYSHKFKGPGLRYEIAIAIHTGYIVWVHGPFPCGQYSDRRIVRLALHGALLPGEQYIADSGYRDRNSPALTPTGHNNDVERKRAVIRARHEVVNRRLKQFAVLGHKFRHDREKHAIAFRAVANVTQLMMVVEEPMWDIDG